jgi:dihydrolipoamide dehydrogenase
MVEKDVVVIGGGPGGYAAAIRAAQLGGKVTLVEEAELGGTCLNSGCIPTKTMLRGVELIEMIATAKDYGIETGEISMNYPRLMARKNHVVKALVSGVSSLMRGNGIEVIKGHAKFRAPYEIEITDQATQTFLYSAKKIIIASGSKSASIPVSDTKLPGVIDSSGALQLPRVPNSMVVIGAGPVGLELGTIYAALGARTTILELFPQILPAEDLDVALAMEKELKRFPIQFFTDCQVQAITMNGDGNHVVSARTKDGIKDFEGEYVLMATGRVPRMEGLGLETTGVLFSKKGIEVNEKMETNIPGIYAIGDVTGKCLLAHFASAQGHIAAENAFGENSRMDERFVPRCVYTSPELASVGMTEKQARELGYDLKVGKFPFSANGKAMVMGERNGFVKIVAESAYNEILGIQIVGPHATDMIGEAILAMSMEGTVQDIAQAIHPHPTLAEALKEAALDVFGNAIHIPPRR